ncbi:MAG: NADP-reducing hydrogenase subunit HndA [Chloroflexota bacterium]|jgi:NADH:ubiquinone oxidoreductase subunit E
MARIPGSGIVRGMALTLTRFFQPKRTVMYPEAKPDIPPRNRGRLELVTDEHGTLKCETCFQCAQACPIECIDMGGTDTKGRYAVHWGPAEQYAERREESAMRRSGRAVSDAAAAQGSSIDPVPVEAILERHDYDPHAMLPILEAIQAHYGYLPVDALKRVSRATGAWYAMVYGTATFYRHLAFEPGRTRSIAVCRCAACLAAGGGRVVRTLSYEFGTEFGRAIPRSNLRLEALSTHLPDAPSPLVVIDGEPQRELTAKNAETWAAALAGRYAA